MATAGAPNENRESGAATEAAAPYVVLDVNHINKKEVAVFARPGEARDLTNYARAVTATESAVGALGLHTKDFNLPGGAATGLMTLGRPMDDGQVTQAYRDTLIEIDLSLLGAQSGVALAVWRSRCGVLHT